MTTRSFCVIFVVMVVLDALLIPLAPLPPWFCIAYGLIASLAARQVVGDEL